MKGKLTKITPEPYHIIEDHKCDNCEKPLESNFGAINPYNALEIHFIPYYGGYFDQSGPQNELEERMYRYFWFCKDCADLLIKTFPCLKVNR